MTEPIKKITTKAGETCYRFVIDVGTKPNGKRDQRCYTFGNFKDARAARAKIIADRNRGVLVKPTKVTFDELCQRWLDSRHDVREVTALANGHALKRARAQLGKIQVQQITRADVEGVIRSIQESGLRHRSMEVTRNAIKQVLAYAITEGLISINVAAYVKLPRKPHSDAKPITVWEPSELLAFREVADRDEWAAGWRLTLCGLRRSEVLGLKWSAVDLDRGEIRVEASRVLLDGGTRTATDDPKSKASRRTVPVEAIQPGTVAILRSLRARQAADKLALGEAYEETGVGPGRRSGTAFAAGGLQRSLPSAEPSGWRPRRHLARRTAHARADDAPSGHCSGRRGRAPRAHARGSSRSIRPADRTRSPIRCQRPRRVLGETLVKFS